MNQLHSVRMFVCACMRMLHIDPKRFYFLITQFAIIEIQFGQYPSFNVQCLFVFPSGKILSRLHI